MIYSLKNIEYTAPSIVERAVQQIKISLTAYPALEPNH